MSRCSIFLFIGTLAGSGIGCSKGPHSPAGFRLADDGDVERGKMAFAELKCNTCHEVAGVDLGKPTIDPPVPVVLGGKVPSPKTDGYLVTSIINPSFELAPYPASQITAAGKSRMPAYDRISVRQLTDIVAFLQSRYVVVRVPPSRFVYYSAHGT
jgi:mono/diheme cytochrome c family protein